MRPVILSAGSINADFLFFVDRTDGWQETRIAHGMLRTSGGKAANRAVQGGRLGATAYLFGCVGDDDLAEQALSGPEASAGVDATQVGVAPGGTGVAAILVDRNGQKSIVFAGNANDGWSLGYGAGLARRVTNAPAGSVFACDLEVRPAVLTEAVTAASRRGFAVVVDPSPPDRITSELWSDHCHLTPNAEEAAHLTGITVGSAEDAAAAGAELVARGVGAAYVKLGAGGCVVVERNGEGARYTAPPASVLDATGAGDAFAGTLAVALAEGHSPRDAAVLAVAAATASVGHRGSQESYASRLELDRVARKVQRTAIEVPAVDTRRRGALRRRQ